MADERGRGPAPAQGGPGASAGGPSKRRASDAGGPRGANAPPAAPGPSGGAPLKQGAARRATPARLVAFTGMLFALAMVLAWLESLLAPVLGLPPGVKPGLANVVVMYALFFASPWQALLLVLLKAGFGLLTRGGVAGLLSLAGGLLSLGVMLLPALWARLRGGRQLFARTAGEPTAGAKRPRPAARSGSAPTLPGGASPAAGSAVCPAGKPASALKRPSILILSVAGALAHNAGQLLVVRLLFGPYSLYYAPVLAVAGIVAGCLTAVTVRALAPAVGLAAKRANN